MFKIMKVKNPKTSAQTLQRVLVKVVAFAYAMLKAICNHSFEGFSNGFDCMNKFKKVNCATCVSVQPLSRTQVRA